MSTEPGSPTTVGLIAKAAALLGTAGYKQVEGIAPEWESATRRLFEDPYNVVGVAVLDTCATLIATWPDLQASLVDVITKYVSSTDGKAWDGYLVLLTPSVAPSEHRGLDEIRYNTARLRKLVATGEELAADADVERVLRPLVPLNIGAGTVEEDATLALLPQLLSERGVPTAQTEAVVRAFGEGASLMERIHAIRTGP